MKAGYKCEECGAPAKVVMPKDNNVLNAEPENMLVLCYKCRGELNKTNFSGRKK